LQALIKRTEKLTVVLVESASDWLAVPFDSPPKQGNQPNQYKLVEILQTLTVACNGKTKQHQQPSLFPHVGSNKTTASTSFIWWGLVHESKTNWEKNLRDVLSKKKFKGSKSKKGGN